MQKFLIHTLTTRQTINMAALTGYNKMFAGTTTSVDTGKKHELGARAFDADGNEFIYLTGVASTIAGSWVIFDEDHLTSLVTNAVTSSAVGRIAIAMAATDATTEFGWYQIYGKNALALANADITVDKQLYLTATAGYVDDADAHLDLIKGAICRVAAVVGTASAFTVELNYPFVNCAADD